LTLIQLVKLFLALMNLNIVHRVLKNPLFDPVLSQINPIQNFTLFP